MNKVEKTWQSNGLVCAVLALDMGHRCGYVGVSKNHPWYGKEYNGLDINVHGGLTYARDDSEDYPLPKNNLWFFGFDCAHYGDGKDYEIMSEDFKKVFNSFNFGGQVRTLEYCIEECENLARQLANVN